ncbi:uncharacterized protein LOC135154842 [Lytechinus pictus]|uniref:uncharacterized protein LOC135154842 n=1 Tax=Lytechinus pictus TaxID=7653 RepID=UPI0030BA189A
MAEYKTSKAIQMAVKRTHLSLWIVSAFVFYFFSGIRGEVPDDTVYTELHKDVRIGDSAVLTCHFRGSPLAVYWKKGDNPRSAPNLVSWIPSDDVTGLCEGQRPCEIMEMNENRSLVIKEVSMAEQGRYICRVSNYKGILIHNFTDIRLFSPPIEPYPIINQCQRKEGSLNSTSPKGCRISTNATIVTITCSAFGFYPDINLFFLHGFSKVTNFKSIEWENKDGSKNKTILIEATVSDRPYVCIASDIPGSKEERAGEIFIDPFRSDETTSANPEKDDGSSGTNPAKIVVPILLILAVATTGMVFLWWRSRKRLARSHIGKRDVEEAELLMQKLKVQGVVSFYELWLLAYDTPNDEMANVYAALVKLGITNIKGQMGRRLVYDTLCKWKERSYAPDQPQMLRDALEEVGLDGTWQVIYEQVRQVNYSTKVPEGTFEQILLDLKEKKGINKFLNNLFPRENIVTEIETINDSNHSEEGNKNVENSAPAKEVSDTHDGQEKKKNTAPAKAISATHDGPENKENTAPAKAISDTHDGPEKKENTAPAKEVSDTHDGPVNKENTAPAKAISDTHDGQENKENTAPAKAISNTHDSQENKENTAPAKAISATHDDQENRENTAPAKAISDTHDLQENKENTAPSKAISDTHDGKENKENIAPAKEVSDIHDVDQNKEKSASGMRKLKEWNKGPFKQNPFVLVSLALERAGYLHISQTFFDGPVSFYELRSLMYDVNTPSLEKLRKTICELGIDETSANNFGPQQIYDYLCQWKDGHPQVDQGKLLHDALLRAGHEEAWSKVLEQRKERSDVSESTFKKILCNVTAPAVIQQLLKRLDPDIAGDLDTSLETDVTPKALEAMKEWNERPLNENRMIVLSRALEKAKCRPINRTVLYETMSYFELWSMVHFDFDTNVITLPLRDALKAMGVLGIDETISRHEVYHLLCKWKEEHSYCDQRLVFKVHLLNEGLHKEWENFSDLRLGTDRIISDETLEHILWHLKTPGKIQHFIHKLTNTDQESIPEDSNLPESIRIALTRLELWKKGPINIHPVILLSEALESAKCSNVAMTFFQGNYMKERRFSLVLLFKHA